MMEVETLISIQRARELIRERVHPLGSEWVSLDQALGRVLAEPVCADRDLPAFDRVTMDGIAVRFREGQRTWQCAGVQYAGDAPLQVTTPSDAIEVMTGAQLPGGADTVIPVEWLEREASQFRLRDASTPAAGQFVHPAGSDSRQGSELIPAGTRIHAVAASVCASVGAMRLCVRRLPRVAFLSTGNELVAVSAIPGPQCIRRSNDRMVAAECAKVGISLQANLHLPDDPARIEATLRELREQVDWIVFSGGVSMGKADHIPAVAQQCGFVIGFHKVRQKPGGPLLFAQHPSGCGLLGLPGNPLSSLVCARLYLRSIFECQSGFPLSSSWVRLAESERQEGPKGRLLPVRRERSPDGDEWMRSVPPNTSGDMVRVLASDGFVILPAVTDHASPVCPGVEFLDWNT